MNKVLLIGSGPTATLVRTWLIPDDWIVCCIHNAWQVVPNRFNILIHAMDFPEDSKPKQLGSNQRFQQTLDWVRQSFNTDKHSGFWRNHCGYGKTMFFTSFWWIYENLKPNIIGFLGCDMNYPNGNNTFYGNGSPDPLKYPIKSLLHWLGFIDGFCVRDDVMLINYSPCDSPTLLPFSHGIFPNEKPLGREEGREREHRCSGEYWPKVAI